MVIQTLNLLPKLSERAILRSRSKLTSPKPRRFFGTLNYDAVEAAPSKRASIKTGKSQDVRLCVVKADVSLSSVTRA